MPNPSYRLDLIAALLLVLAACAFTFGGVQLFYGAARVSVRPDWRIAAILAGVVAVRHLLVRRPTVLARAADAAVWASIAARSRSFRVALPVWLTFRLGVLAVALIAMATISVPPAADQLRNKRRPVLDLAARWDTNWYAQIAITGYTFEPNSRQQQNIAFFPGYPLVAHVGKALIGGRTSQPLLRHQREIRLRERTLIAAWLIALASGLAALCALYRWAEQMAGGAVAARAVLLISAFPFSLYYSAAYTESLFLLCCVSAFNASAADRPGRTAAWGVFAGLLRPNGMFLAVPLALLAWQRRSLQTRAAALTPVLGAALYSAYIWHLTGNPLGWAAAHAAWGRTASSLDNSVVAPVMLLIESGLLAFLFSNPYDVLNGLAVIFALALLPIVWRRLGAAPALFILANLLPPLVSGGLLSMGRLVSTMFPLFVGLAILIPRRHVAFWAAGFALLQGLTAALFFTWRQMI